jgi:hypothetical protein
MTNEALTKRVMRHHRLTSIHLFTKPDGWRCFGFRRDAKGFDASVENGDGETIAAAIEDMDQALTEGPIKARARRAQQSKAETT